MKTYNFPYIAFALGLILMATVMIGSSEGGDGTTRLPLLTLLIASEFAFFVNVFAVYIGIRHTLASGARPVYVITTVLCVLLAAGFAYLGIGLWPLSAGH